jgi:hypothetical protein
MTSLYKYYKLAALLPLGLTTILGIIFSITHDGSKFKSEWFTDDGFVLTVILTILLSGFISILSLTIFLNNKQVIKTNTFFSFISWVVIPGIVSGYIIYQEFLNFSGHSDIGGVYEGNRLLDGYIMSMAIMHLLALIVTSLHYFYFDFKSYGS